MMEAGSWAGGIPGMAESDGNGVLPELGDAELRELSGAFSPARWLRDVGRTSWLLVGVFALVFGIVWLLGTTMTIAGPVVVAAVVACVASPVVGLLKRHRVPRAAGAAIVILGALALGGLVLVLVIGGITSQSDAIAAAAAKGADRVAGWLSNLGVNQAGVDSAKEELKSTAPGLVSTLVHGVLGGVRGFASFVFALSLTVLSLFFLLKDGPAMRHWVDRHLGLPRPVAQVVTGELIGSLRGYFRGVTIVAVFNGVVVGLAALLLDVPLAGTIAVVSFVTAYIPYLGAVIAGTFAVVIALGAKGTATAVALLVIFILANGLLQNLVQPFAMGAALDLHPLVVLVVTIGAGCVFGTLGLILAAPLTSAAVHVTRRISHARAATAIAQPPPVPTAST
jgi:predicted PurR-regulated permease PerM